MRRILLATLSLALGQAVLAANSPDQSPAAPAAAPQAVSVAASSAETEQPKVVCHQEAAIGSMMMHKVCTRVQSESERNATQEALRNMAPNNSIAHPAAGSLVH